MRRAAVKIRRMVLRQALCALSAAALAGCSSAPAEGESTVKVLVIGNSFSICVLQHLPSIALDRGVDLDLASLYIGGC